MRFFSVLLLLCLLPAAGLARLAEQGSHWLLLAYLLASVLVFAAYLHDKRRALRSGWRPSPGHRR